MSELLEHLNAPQREAVTHGDGPLLVLAGAGSGKTRVLCYRIAHLVASGRARPFEITAVTFTNKAAREMSERVLRLVDEPLAGGFVGTFHRWALDILRRYPAAAGLPPRFAILDSDDQRALMNRCLKNEGLDAKHYPPRMVLSVISKQVNGCRDLDSFEAAGGHDPALTALWRQYRRLKTAAGAVDFDDMLALTLALLGRDRAIRAMVARRARYLLVDEFQDTNRLQMELLHTVLDGDRNLTAVGDEDQSIYRWRGAEMDNILGFEKHFPGAHVVAMEQNYRSTAAILQVAGAVIEHNQQRRGKRLFTSASGGERVQLYEAIDERDEARWVVDLLEQRRREVDLAAMAVLMRTNAQSRPFEEELTRRHIPYRVVGGLRFWQRAEVKDAMAYLRLLTRPDDSVAFERVVNVPARGIGAVTVDTLRQLADDRGEPLPTVARSTPEELTPRARVALQRFFEILDQAAGRRDELDAGDLVGWLLEATGLLSLYDGDDEDKVARRENLQQLAAAVAEAEAQGQSLDEFLDAVALLADGDESGAADAVSLMTLHAAKGLEFELVALAGLEDGLLPHASGRDDGDALEEERRLAYVGMTRARRWLALSSARSRFLFGTRSPTAPSRFLAELPPGVVDVESSRSFVPGPPVTAMSVTASRPTRPQPPPRPKGVSRVSNTATDATGTGWRPGNRVRHHRFGTGMVLSCQGHGPQLKLVVYFDRVGRKTLLPTIAKLEKI